MDPTAVRDYLHRDRDAVERRKRDHWVRRFREEGPAATIAASRALYDHVRRVHPEYPTPRDRAEDLAHHVEMTRKLERVCRALSVR